MPGLITIATVSLFLALSIAHMAASSVLILTILAVGALAIAMKGNGLA
mgnify:CR=1 FL=1